MWNNVSDATTRLAIRRLFAAYLIVAGVALLFPHRPASWPVLVLLHALAVYLLLDPRPLSLFARKLPRTARFINDWYLLLLIPALYKELATLNLAIFNGHYFDAVILRTEQGLFGQQPSRELAHTLPYLPLSELLHFCYLSYYLIIYVPPILLYSRGRYVDFHRLVFNLMLVFFGHYIFFIYFPVQGPRYLFPAPGGNIARGRIYQLARKLLEGGSSRGAAFPSSHVGVSTAQTAFAFLTQPRVAPVLLFLSTGLAIGAVYAGFHYATDAMCGFAYGLTLFFLAPRIARVLGRGA